MIHPFNLLSLDPGSEKTAIASMTFTGKKTLLEHPLILHSVKHLENRDVCTLLHDLISSSPPHAFVCEGMRMYAIHASKGVAHVGASVFETCEWIGVFRNIVEEAGRTWVKLYRPDIANLIAYDPRAKNPALRLALEEAYGKVGTGKATAGPLFALRGHADHGVASLAVGVAYYRKLCQEEAEAQRALEKARCRESTLA